MNLKTGFLALCLLFLSACGHPPATISPEGKLTILDFSHPQQNLETLKENWIVLGVNFSRLTAPDLQALALVEDGTTKALKIKTIPSSYLLARETAATTLVASPYLSWTWKSNTPPPPYRLVVGFQGGAPKSNEWGLSSLSSSLPSFDRSITLIQKKDLSTPKILNIEKKQAQISYGVAPFLKNRWKTEVIDLHGLYASIWPADRLGGVKVVFIGLSAHGTLYSQSALLKSITLSR